MGTHKNYVNYLRNNPRWQEVRWAAFRRDKGRCRICNRDLALVAVNIEDARFDSHHASYEFFGRELESEESLATC